MCLRPCCTLGSSLCQPFRQRVPRRWASNSWSGNLGCPGGSLSPTQRGPRLPVASPVGWFCPAVHSSWASWGHSSVGWCSVPWHGEPAVQRGTGLCVVATAFPGTSCSFLGLLGGWVPHAERRTGPGPREDLAGVGRALGTGAQRQSMVAAVQWSSVLGPAVHGVSSGRRRGVRPHLRAEVAGLPEGPGSTPQWAPDMVRVAPAAQATPARDREESG